MNKNYKKLAVLVAVLMLTLSITTTGFATDTVANLKAYYRNIKMYRNGTQVQISAEPFIVNDTTYLPVKAISELLDKEVTWNQATYSIGVNDRPGTDVNALASQILNQQLTIAQLEAKVKALTAQVGSSMDLDDLEDNLIDDYDEIYDVTIEDFKLDGDEDDIEVEIYVDLEDDDEYAAWNELDDNDIEDFLQDIVNDILDEYENADITGFIEDEYGDAESVDFTISSSGSVSLDGSSTGSGDLADLEDELNEDYDRYYYETNEYVSFSIDVTGDEDDILLELDIDEDDLDILTDSEIEDYLEEIYEVVEDYFSNAYVEGYLVDGTIDLAYFNFSSSGVVDLDWE